MRAAIWLLGCALLAGSLAPAHARPARPAAGKPPAAPSIAPGERTFVAFAGKPARVRIAWSAAPDLGHYRALWNQAGSLIDIELAGNATSFEREVSTAGHHQLTLVAVDAVGRESQPVEVGIDIVAVAAIPPGSEEPVSAAVPGFAVGARFRSPGLTCRLGEGPVGPEATARQAGAAMLRCGAEGGPRVEVPVVIAPVLVDGPKKRLARGVATKMHLTVASVARLGERLDLEAVDADLSGLRRTEHGFEVAVTPRDGAVTTDLVVRSAGVEIGRAELLLVEPPPPPPPGPPPTDWFALDVGWHVGVLAPTGDRPAIGVSDKELMHRPLGGGRVGLFPTQRVGIETEVALVAPDYRPGQKTWLVSARAHLAVRVLERGDVGLQLVGGAGALNANGMVHYGGAFTFETRQNLWLRVGVLHAIATARDAGYAHCLELSFGLVTRLGRRDRGW